MWGGTGAETRTRRTAWRPPLSFPDSSCSPPLSLSSHRHRWHWAKSCPKAHLPTRCTGSNRHQARRPRSRMSPSPYQAQTTMPLTTSCRWTHGGSGASRPPAWGRRSWPPRPQRGRFQAYPEYVAVDLRVLLLLLLQLMGASSGAVVARAAASPPWVACHCPMAAMRPRHR